MNSPIGVFDSGVGGLSVLHHIRVELPHEDLLYVADSAYAPYGTKTPEQIQARSLILADFLLAQGAKALVVACNTATAAAARLLREHFAVPVIAMEPAVKPAVAATRSGVVGVLATSGTLKSSQFAALLENYGKDVCILTQAGLGLVECVERGALDGEETRALLLKYLGALRAEGADTLVLGCTHYPFLRPLIEELAGELNWGEMTLIDTGAAVARHLRRRIDACSLATTSDGAGWERFWTSGDPVSARDVMSRLWGRALTVAPLPASTSVA
jgi:glutamate racemase